MGDRCHCTVQCRRQDVKAFEDVGFEEDCVLENGLVSMEGEEINYALNGQEPEVPFTLDHGSGGAYSEGEIASDGHLIKERETAFNSGYYVAADGNGDIYPEDLKLLKEFIQFKTQVTQWMVETNIGAKE